MRTFLTPFMATVTDRCWKELFKKEHFPSLRNAARRWIGDEVR